MNAQRFVWRATALVGLLATTAACTAQFRGLGGAALPQTVATSADAPAGASSPPDALSATGALSGTAPIAVPYQSNDDAASRVTNPWQALLDDASASAAGPDAGRTAPADAVRAIDAAAPAGVDGAAAPAAAGDAPIGRSALPTAGTPAACKAMLKPLADALQAGSYADVSLTTVMADGTYGSRATGGLSRVAQLGQPGQPAGFTLESRLSQLFSDRTYMRPRVLPPGVTKCTLPCTMSQPYDAARPDTLQLQIDGATGATTLLLLSWGDGTVRLTPSCDANLMWGFGGGMFYVITLKRT